MKTNSFIVIEGIDGAGKSTVSKEVAHLLGAAHFQTPPAEFKRARGLFDPPININARFLFYLSAVAITSDQIRRTLEQRSVVCDRYVASTMAYHRALGLSVDLTISQLQLLDPDYTFFLMIGDEVKRRRRLVSRSIWTAADALVEDREFRDRVLTEYRKFPMIEIDTDNLRANDVAARIVKDIRDTSGII